LFHPDYLLDLRKLSWVFYQSLDVVATLLGLLNNGVKSLYFLLLLLDDLTLLAGQHVVNGLFFLFYFSPEVIDFVA